MISTEIISQSLRRKQTYLFKQGSHYLLSTSQTTQIIITTSN